MNESISPIAPAEPDGPSYKDRSTGLVIFGAMTLLIGCLAGLFALLIVGAQMAGRAAQPSGGAPTVVPAVALYGVLAVALIWLGIGSIMVRRWARALLLIFSWSWLLLGIFATIGMVFFIPIIMANAQAAAPPGHPASRAAMAAAMVFVFIIFGIFFLLLPALWLFFYNSRHVKATCEAHDPEPCWTDRCPLPVLALSLWLMFSVPMMVLMPIGGHAVLPFFGVFFSGIPGAFLYFAIAVLWCYAAWLIYHVNSRGWWLVLIAMIVFTVSGVITFSQHDILEMYQRMGYPQTQINQIQKMGLFGGNSTVWMTIVSVLPLVGYMLFIKRYFRKTP